MRQLLFLPPHNNLIHRIPLVHHIIILERGLLHNRAQLSKKIDFGLGERGIWCKKRGRMDGVISYIILNGRYTKSPLFPPKSRFFPRTAPYYHLLKKILKISQIYYQVLWRFFLTYNKSVFGRFLFFFFRKKVQTIPSRFGNLNSTLRGPKSTPRN